MKTLFTLRMAFRNLKRQRRRTLFTGLMMTGGFLLCSVFLGVSEGSYASIIDFFTRDHTGHLQIHRRGYLDNPSLQTTVDDWDHVRQFLAADPKVVSAAPRVYSSVLAFVGKRTVGARLVGMDPALEASTSRLKTKVSEGSYFPGKSANEILAGNGIAQALGLKVGSQVALVGQGADGSVADDLFTVVGLVQSGGEAGLDHNLYLRLGDAQTFLALGTRIHEVAVILKDIGLAREESRVLAAKLNDPNLDVEPWQVVEKDFYRAMTADKDGDYFTQIIFLVLVALGVLNTVLMNVLERVPEYGLLKALGTRSSTLTAMILWEMVCLALLSIALGAALAWGANAYLAAYGLHMPEAYTYGGMVFSTMYGQLSWPVFLIPAALILLMAVLVCLPAALRVRRLSPVEALRRS